MIITEYFAWEGQFGHLRFASKKIFCLLHLWDGRKARKLFLNPHMELKVKKLSGL